MSRICIVLGVLAALVAVVSATCGQPGQSYAYCGDACYVIGEYVCHNNNTLCPSNAPELCGGACYNRAQYKCCFGVSLAQANQVCPPIPECCGGSGPKIGSPGERAVCYSLINKDPFRTNPGTGEPYLYYNPCGIPGVDRKYCTGVKSVEEKGCRMCGLDPVNDIRCKDWVPSTAAPKRSGTADFQCPCEVIEYLRQTNQAHLLPPIYRVDPVCQAPTDCEINDPPNNCLSDCGEGVCYDPAAYVCNNGTNLCPKNAPLSCGKACYSSTSFTCCPGGSLFTGNENCPDNTPTTPGCCPLAEYLGNQEQRDACYDFVTNPNPTTGEPYFYYNPCTSNGDQTQCVSGAPREAGCRECFLDPVNDIRCPGVKRSGSDALVCPCDIITYLFEKNPSLLPAIYKKPAQCPGGLPVACSIDKLYGGTQAYTTTTNSAGVAIYSLALVALSLIFLF